MSKWDVTVLEGKSRRGTGKSKNGGLAKNQQKGYWEMDTVEVPETSSEGREANA